MLTKIATHIFEGVYYNGGKELKDIKNLCQNRKTRVILLPLYKSYADPLVLFLIQYLNNMQLGFTVGSLEDCPKINSVKNLLHKMGHLHMKR